MAQSHQKHTYYAQEGQKSKRLHEFPTQKKYTYKGSSFHDRMFTYF